MEPQLVTLIELTGPQGLIGEYVWHELAGRAPGTGRRFWVRIVDVDAATGRFWLEDGNGELFHRSVDKSELRIGVGSRYPGDTLLIRLREKGLQSDIFEMAVPGAPPTVLHDQPAGCTTLGTGAGICPLYLTCQEV